MVEKSVVFLPLVWTFAPNDLPQPLQNLTVKLAIDGLTRRYKFLVVQCLGCRKNNQHGLDIAANLTCFFGHGEFGDFHWGDCCLLRVITIHHVSSLVMILEMILGSSLACLSSLQTETRRAV
jgi:hypothetical protein